MNILNVKQGSQEWLDARGSYLTASEASAMMGASKYVSRSDLLNQKATGSAQEFTEWFQKNVLDKGHKVEALARPIAEDILGETLFPVTGINEDETLLASFDGVNMMETIIWECKQWNEEKATEVRSGIVPECDKWQVVHQLEVSQAKKAMYMVTDGTPEKTVYCWMEPSQENTDRLMNGWSQFAEDLANHVPVETKAAPTGETPELLPSLIVELSGAVKSSNLEDFKRVTLKRISEINTNLVTDEDFATAEKTVKFLDKAEKDLQASKEAALNQTIEIRELFATIDALKVEMRDKRLNLNKSVKSEKENRRLQILDGAENDFRQWLASQDSPMSFSTLSVRADVVSAMKGKKTITSLQSAADDTVAAKKAETRQTIDLAKINNLVIDEQQEYKFLFSDWAMLLDKPTDYLKWVIAMRISQHKEVEQRKAEEAAQRIEAQRLENERLEAQKTVIETEPAPVVAKPTFQSIPKSPVSEEVISITVKEYRELKAASALLDRFYDFGIEQWDNFDAVTNPSQAAS